MVCTFDSPCLTSAIGGLQPSFGFHGHNTNLLGIQASFTSGSSTCYTGGTPTWKPVIKAGGLGVTCTWIGPVQSIYCPDLAVADIATGTHTLSFSAPSGSPAPFSPTPFIIAKSAEVRPEETIGPVIMTKYVTVTIPSTTATTTKLHTISTDHTIVVNKGATYVADTTEKVIKYTHGPPKVIPKVVTVYKSTSVTHLKTSVKTSTEPCVTYTVPFGKRDRLGPLMNYELLETIVAGSDATATVPLPCHGPCQGWSGPDITYKPHPHPQHPTMKRDTLTYTHTDVKHSGTKTVSTTSTTWKVGMHVSTTPARTLTVPSYTTSTSTVHPATKYSGTKYVTKYHTYSKHSIKYSTKTVPCPIKTVTSMKTRTHYVTGSHKEHHTPHPYNGAYGWKDHESHEDQPGQDKPEESEMPMVAVHEPAAPEPQVDEDIKGPVGSVRELSPARKHRSRKSWKLSIKTPQLS